MLGGGALTLLCTSNSICGGEAGVIVEPVSSPDTWGLLREKREGWPSVLGHACGEGGEWGGL